MRFPFVSARAWVPDGCSVAVLPVAAGVRVDLWVLFPRGACPVSGNPILGLARVQYVTSALVAELVSVRQLVVRAGRSPVAAAQSVEGCAAWISAEISRAVGVPVAVTLLLLVRPGPQLYRVTCG